MSEAAYYQGHSTKDQYSTNDFYFLVFLHLQAGNIQILRIWFCTFFWFTISYNLYLKKLHYTDIIMCKVQFKNQCKVQFKNQAFIKRQHFVRNFWATLLSGT